MLDEEFEVKGHHEVSVEHDAEHHVPLAQKVALFSAVLATLGAIVSFLAGHTQNEALYHKNEAVLLKAKASDQWAYYEAESGKQHVAELAFELVPASRQDHFKSDIAKYSLKKAGIQKQAQKLDERSDEANEQSEHDLAPHNKLAVAMTFIQVAIALASIAALTRRSWLLAGAAIAAALGLAFAITGWVL